jgi:hypothetical protein
MPIEFVPSQAIVASLAACVLLPAVLLLVSHGLTRIGSPGRRFVVATLLTWAVWVMAMIALGPGWVDFTTGLFLLLTTTLAGFTLWTLIAWGFTLSMVLALARCGRPLSIEEWAEEYTRGKSLSAFARDRLGILLVLGLVEVHGERVIMTSTRGRIFAKSAAALRALFGLPR